MNIYDERKKSKLTQAQLSKAVGVSLTTIQNWETTNTKPSADNMERLKIVFGVSDASEV